MGGSCIIRGPQGPVAHWKYLRHWDGAGSEEIRPAETLRNLLIVFGYVGHCGCRLPMELDLKLSGKQGSASFSGLVDFEEGV